MCLHTSFRIGGPADLFLEPTNLAALQGIVAKCRELEIPYFVLGNGSNLLVSDLGVEGAVIHLGGTFCEAEMNGACEICCGAGAKLSRICSLALEQGLSGLEFAWGIPGSVGGAVYMNAGAYGGEMKQVLVSCTHLNPDGTVETLAGEELDLSYRHSVYTGQNRVILSAQLRLHPGNSADIRLMMDELLIRRKQKQPLEFPSAGSTFKRPAGHFAGTLVEECGLKGYTIGGAQVSQQHAGFVINTGNATCTDVLNLMEHIRREVFLQTSITLEPEVKRIGRFSSAE